MWFQLMLGTLLLLRYNKPVVNLGCQTLFRGPGSAYNITTNNATMRTPSAREL